MALPLRIMSLHALAYCERLFYLEEVEVRGREGSEVGEQKSGVFDQGRSSKLMQCFGRINWKSRRSSVSKRLMLSRSAVAAISASTKSIFSRRAAQCL